MISLRVNRRLSVYRSWNDDGWLAMIYKSFRDTHFVSIAVRPTCFEINKSISTTKITPNDSPLCQPRGRFMKRFGGDFQLYGWPRANLQSRWKSLTRHFMKCSWVFLFSLNHSGFKLLDCHFNCDPTIAPIRSSRTGKIEWPWCPVVIQFLGQDGG